MTAAKPARLPAEARKAIIVETALRLSDEAGPELVTTEKIASALGLTQPAIFRHFPKKELIWTAVAEWLETQMTAVWDEANSETVAPAAELKLITMAHVKLLAATPGISAILFSRELHFNNDLLREGLARNQKLFQARLEASIRRGIGRGDFRAGLDPRDAALLIIAVIQSAALRWSLAQQRFDLAAEADQLLELQISCFR